MTRSFFKFVKTHPRKGKNVRRIAFLEGRYAAPFNGFICGTEQDPHYSVWGRYGCNDETWGHKQPEKCRQLLDVLNPGANTHPLRQKFDKRRFFFSGTPYGDFDCIPVEASKEYFGLFHVLGGVISPLDGIGPEQLSIGKLVERVQKENVQEVIIATNPTIDGDVTALYIQRALSGTDVKISRLASGLPVGGDLEYADKLTLARSFSKRQSL
jgi:hypothetical protein